MRPPTNSVEACRLFIEKWKGHALIVPPWDRTRITCPPEVLRPA
jgi:hypothetical protein